MDNVFAIGVGLTLRLVINTVTNHNHRVNGSLVGLWEGAVLHHFLAKFPRSLDPYVAFGFRLFVDLLFTTSVMRLAIVVLWTGLGMLLSDVSFELLEDRRFRRIWRRVRRALPSSLKSLTPARSSSRVQFLQVPTRSSTASSANTARSPILRSPLSPQSRPQLRSPLSPQARTIPVPRPAPAPAPASVRRPSARPLPGSFTDLSEAETDASRAQQRDRTRTPSELEYITMPVIPDTPGIETYPSYIRPPATRSVASGLTTSNESDRLPAGSEGRPHDYSGLTSPVGHPSSPARRDELPPVTIIDYDDPQGQNRTPTNDSVELLDPPPIPIPMRPPSGFAEFIPPELMDPRPTPSIAPALGDMLDISTPEEEGGNLEATEPHVNVAQTERSTATRSPPPGYTPKVGDPIEAASLAESDGTATSIIANETRSVLIQRADTLRQEAEKLELKRATLRRELSQAERERDTWSAFRLRVELTRADQGAMELHKKAERRYYKAHNQKPQPQEIDVHRLKVPEARARVEEALYGAMMAGVPELRIITGRGNHSKGKIPALKLAIIGQLQDYHIEAVEDATNPGVLLVHPPANPSTSST
ncbi:hypothetical protein POSPLADRAFT_1068890 [Postia placenta MAD-698-R-SB12]|uniref:Smr domain-containing protein n=1 Tax=Postia placenta MAD-698-R-SB12 TaxID=670580 RepID=A0A1X6NBX7_9APHY|nr:hypothetical protein POSPLADRAFT_1068890 [Postia placenta MAD-698-R-SB12]OSX66074.1 hypothetical protein POSPLADRAFT_1068890 [Postia placenta MAD-698-R-SB12]